jgi:Ricin-type beta-trefoil lectin domain/IPT/TIG domain
LSATAAVVTVFGSPAAMAAASTDATAAGGAHPAAPAARAAKAAADKPDYKAACTTHPARGYAACLALIRTDVPAHKGASPFVTPSGYGPAQLQSAYGLPSSSAGSGATVALVDAYDDPNAAADLAVYRSQFGLPACTTANGCFKKVNENGLTSPLPPTEPPNDDWATEESLDIDMVSAACPLCHIDLVEADSASITDLGTAVDSAVALGAQYVSNSYGGSEFSGESSDDVYYNHPGAAITVSAGDDGYRVSYPAASPDVVSVGGTSLHASGSGYTESVWGSSAGGEGTGSGCSGYESKPSWQTDSGCSDRTDNDVAAVADPNTGVAVYDTYDQGGWLVVGGTSASSPIIASVFALAGVPSAGSYPAEYVYDQHSSSNMHDVTTGANGTCTPAYLCTGEVGYDGPTGWGTPDGVSAFKAPSGTPRPRPVVTRIKPTSGPAAGGTSVKITGTSLAGGTVTFGLIPATGVTCAATSCTATSPAGTGTVDVEVTTTGGTSAASSADHFKYAAPLPTGSITSGITGKCVNDLNGAAANQNPIDLRSCTGAAKQNWIVETNGALTNAVNGKCIAVQNGSRSNGARIVLYACNGSNAQVWTAVGAHLVNPASGKCLTAPGSSSGTQLVIKTCGTGVNQDWTLP